MLILADRPDVKIWKTIANHRHRLQGILQVEAAARARRAGDTQSAADQGDVLADTEEPETRGGFLSFLRLGGIKTGALVYDANVHFRSADLLQADPRHGNLAMLDRIEEQLAHCLEDEYFDIIRQFRSALDGQIDPQTVFSPPNCSGFDVKCSMIT